MGWVLVTVGSGDLRAYPLTVGVDAILGRDLDCDIVLEHHRVSRRHARVRVADSEDVLVIEDLGSRSGTRVGEPLAPNQPHVVRAGDAIAIGPFTLIAMREASAQPMVSLVIEDPFVADSSQALIGVARGGASVLIRGEPGAGKQQLAEALHRLSGRGGRLVSLDCAAHGPERLERELFGHEGGAAPGEAAAAPGALEAAGEGTVVLDEIGELPAALQAKLLRAIERREVARIGGGELIPIAARLISTTHRDLPAAALAGELRLDLYYRLAGATLAIPPLRDRRGHIVPFASELLAAAVASDHRPAPALSPAAAARLCAHDWPGNLRELRAVLERALALSAERGDGATIEEEHVVFDEARAQPAQRAPSSPGVPLLPDLATTPGDDAAERRRILHALERCHGNQARAAKLLGISRSALATKLALYRASRPRK